jgi:hypothetical protein
MLIDLSLNCGEFFASGQDSESCGGTPFARSAYGVIIDTDAVHKYLVKCGLVSMRVVRNGGAVARWDLESVHREFPCPLCE